jgi:hypothetical protein
METRDGSTGSPGSDPAHGNDRTTRVLVWTSIAVWAAGSIAFAAVFWDDKPTGGGDVGAGLQGLVVAIAFGIFVILTTIGVALGRAAARRAPDERLPAIALALNIITLFGVLLSILVLSFLS